MCFFSAKLEICTRAKTQNRGTVFNGLKVSLCILLISKYFVIHFLIWDYFWGNHYSTIYLSVQNSEGQVPAASIPIPVPNNCCSIPIPIPSRIFRWQFRFHLWNCSSIPIPIPESKLSRHWNKDVCTTDYYQEVVDYLSCDLSD